MADVYWREFLGTINKDAVLTGHDVYIAQVSLKNGGDVPGTLYPNEKIAVSEDETGRVTFNSNIKYLCSSNPDGFEWVLLNINSLDEEYLKKCVRGGCEVGKTVYIGKIFHEGKWKIGKVFPKMGKKYPEGLRIWTEDGRHYSTLDFHILKFKSLTEP